MRALTLMCTLGAASIAAAAPPLELDLDGGRLTVIARGAVGPALPQAHGDSIEIGLTSVTQPAQVESTDATIKRMSLVAGSRPRLVIALHHGKRTTERLAALARLEMVEGTLRVTVPRDASAAAAPALMPALLPPPAPETSSTSTASPAMAAATLPRATVTAAAAPRATVTAAAAPRATVTAAAAPRPPVAAAAPRPPVAAAAPRPPVAAAAPRPPVAAAAPRPPVAAAAPRPPVAAAAAPRPAIATAADIVKEPREPTPASTSAAKLPSAPPDDDLSEARPIAAASAAPERAPARLPWLAGAALLSGLLFLAARRKKRAAAIAPSLRVLASQSLGGRSRLVLVEAEGRRILLAVNDANTRVVTQYDAQVPDRHAGAATSGAASDAADAASDDELPAADGVGAHAALDAYAATGRAHAGNDQYDDEEQNDGDVSAALVPGSPRTTSPAVSGLLKLRNSDANGPSEWGEALRRAARGVRS